MAALLEFAEHPSLEVTPEVAVAAATTLACAGFGLLIAFVVMHALVLRFAMRGLRRTVARYENRKAFAAAYEAEVYERLQRHPLIGHAWKEFDETLLKGDRAADGVIGNTVRPQAFINYNVIRERLSGLKMLPSISGYFVGAGLLLTFIGIVLALTIAASSVDSASADQMQAAMAKLLHAASFKFWTSISGLGVSIVFGIFARLIIIWIEGGLNRFCDAVETQLRYTAPQSITAEMNAVGREQLDQLRELNSERYFSRFTDVIEQAMARAIAPLANGVGMQIKEGAGAEIQKLGDVLSTLQTSLASMQDGLLRLDSVIAGAAGGASGKIESAMQDVLGKLQLQVGEFLEAMRSHSSSVSNDLREARQQAEDAQRAAREQISAAGSEAAQALRDGIGSVVASIAAEVTRMQGAMELSAKAHEEQAAAIRSAASQTETVAGTLSGAALDVRNAVSPLTQTGQAIARTSEELGRAGSTHAALASALTAQIERLTSTWDGYRTQFDRIDEDLAKAVEALADASERQAGSLTQYVTDIDQGLQKLLGQLKPAIDEIGSSTSELADTLADTLSQFNRPNGGGGRA
jgi:gas vesicle protein